MDNLQKSNLCPHCSGRGFHWHLSGKSIYPTKGPLCEECSGSGKASASLGDYLIIGVVALVIIAFVISPIVHLLLD
jgi:hypothetical protein